MKRAHWSLTYLAIHELRAQAESLRIPPLSDMTPARYDILFAIWQRPVWVTRGEDDTYRMSMGALVEKLGLHPSTVSKCVKGLVELGFVTREVAAHDARCRIVILTRLGLDMLECAKQVLFGRRDDFFFEANEVFAMTAAWNPARLARPVGEGDEDNMLIGVGQQAVACAAGLGSKAWPIYDPTFDDSSFPRLYCWAAHPASRQRSSAARRYCVRRTSAETKTAAASDIVSPVMIVSAQRASFE